MLNKIIILLLIKSSLDLSIIISFGNFSNGGQELFCHFFQLLSLSKRHFNIKTNWGPLGGVICLKRKIEEEKLWFKIMKKGIKIKIKMVRKTKLILKCCKIQNKNNEVKWNKMK